MLLTRLKLLFCEKSVLSMMAKCHQEAAGSGGAESPPPAGPWAQPCKVFRF